VKQPKSITNGHSAAQHRGRFLLGDAVEYAAESGVVPAMERLLQLGDTQATSFFTHLHGNRLHHIERGDGRPLLMLHGACGGAANWYRLIQPLAIKHRVIALDLPGFGLSDPLEMHPPLGANVARTVIEWLDELAIGECDVVGTSFGSLVALRMALAYPARIGRIALINGVGLGRELPIALRLAALSPVSAVAMRPPAAGARRRAARVPVAIRQRERSQAHGRRLQSIQQLRRPARNSYR
jgi:pimeloyl-ACP methyl ester carboxylesterase